MNRTREEALTLTDEERDLLLELLERERHDLPAEIRHTDSPEYHDQLRLKLERVERLLLRIAG